MANLRVPCKVALMIATGSYTGQFRSCGARWGGPPGDPCAPSAASHFSAMPAGGNRGTDTR